LAESTAQAANTGVQHDPEQAHNGQAPLVMVQILGRERTQLYHVPRYAMNTQRENTGVVFKPEITYLLILSRLK
jgi:hypothetical protein